MKKQILSLFLIVLPAVIFAQQEKSEGDKPGISFSGYIKNDIIYDTRKTVDMREGHFLLFPKQLLLDVDSNDINDEPSLNILAIESRLRGDIIGPDAFGAKISGVLEGSFYGHSDTDINGFRLRHAYGIMKWEKSEILFGQYWHPMYTSTCYPDVVSYNTGAPFQPYAWNPQLRFTYHLGKFNILASFLSQRDFTSPGGSMSLRNSGTPDMQLQLSFGSKNEEYDTEIQTGTGVGYKSLKPRLITGSNYMAKGTVNSLSALAYIKYKGPDVTMKIKGVWGQNMYDLLMLGGYAVLDTTFDDNYKNDFDSFDYRDYTTLDVFSLWADFHTNGENIQAGLFFGFSKNLASLHNILGNGIVPEYFESRGSYIDYLYRVASRMSFNSGSMRISGEVEYTVAAYGNILNSLGEVQDESEEFPKAEIREVTNLRLLLAFYYFF